MLRYRTYGASYACVTRTTHARVRDATRSRARTFFLLPLPSSAFALSLFRPSSLMSPFYPSLCLSLSLSFLHSVVDIRTARSNITIRSQTNSLAMPGRLPFTGRTVVSPVWPDLDCTWGVVTVGTHIKRSLDRIHRTKRFLLIETERFFIRRVVHTDCASLLIQQYVSACIKRY